MSKGEIFQSKGITPIEKRLLMKFMQVTSPPPFEENQPSDKPSDISPTV